MSSQDIKKLTPAAARLLLSFLSARHAEPYDSVVARSGIREYKTVSQAYQQLEAFGFVLQKPDGTHMATLVDLTAHLDVGETKTTKAYTPPLARVKEQ